MMMYFYRLYSKINGFVLNPGVRTLFNTGRDTLPRNVRREMDQHSIRMFYKSIQFVNTTNNYYLQNLLPDYNLKLWGEMIDKNSRKVGDKCGGI